VKPALTTLTFLLCACSRATPPAPSVLPSYDGAWVVYPHPAKCEVEIGGRVTLPKDSHANPPMTFVAIGDCLAEHPQMIGFGGTTNNGYFIEVFAPWGSDLTICAASEPSPGQPSTLYGRSKLSMHAEAAGEVTFHDVLIELKEGPPKTFPRP